MKKTNKAIADIKSALEAKIAEARNIGHNEGYSNGYEAGYAAAVADVTELIGAKKDVVSPKKVSGKDDFWKNVINDDIAKKVVAPRIMYNISDTKSVEDFIKGFAGL